MALVPCRICKTQVSYKAENCPKCGEPDPSRRQRNSKIFNFFFAAAILAAVAAYTWFVYIPDIREHGLFNTNSQRK